MTNSGKPMCLVLLCISIFWCGQAVAGDQQKLDRLVKAMQLPAGQREQQLAAECKDRRSAYDPVGEVVAMIQRETKLSCLYFFPGSGTPWNCRTNWGKVCLSYSFEYAPDSKPLKFKRIEFLRHDPTNGSVFVLEEKGTTNRWCYCFSVMEDGGVKLAILPFESQENGNRRPAPQKRKRN